MPFYLLLRMYLPDIEVLNGQYVIPGVVKTKCLQISAPITEAIRTKAMHD